MSEKSQVSIVQKFRWNMIFEFKWKVLKIVSLPSEYFGQLHRHFQAKLDEIFFMCSYGVLNVLKLNHPS